MWRYESRARDAPVPFWNTLALLCQSVSQGIWRKNFLSYVNNNYDANLLYSEDFIQKLAWLVEIFETQVNCINQRKILTLMLWQKDDVREFIKCQNCGT
jgi:hypothetical protein